MLLYNIVYTKTTSVNKHLDKSVTLPRAQFRGEKRF